VIVRFRSEAATDVSLARDWYDAQSPGLGDSFVSALEQVIDLVGALPEAFPEIAVGLSDGRSFRASPTRSTTVSMPAASTLSRAFTPGSHPVAGVAGGEV
jgi:hypothetical protein